MDRATVLRTGESRVMPELPDDVLRTMCEDDEHLRLIRELETRTVLAVPLVARGQTLGVLSLGSSALIAGGNLYDDTIYDDYLEYGDAGQYDRQLDLALSLIHI